MLLKLLIGAVFICFAVFATLTLLYILNLVPQKKKKKQEDEVSVAYTSHIELDE